MPIPPPKPTTQAKDAFDDLDDDGWEDMPIIRASDNPLGLDEEDAKKYHYVEPKKRLEDDFHGGNATGNLIDFDDKGNEWRSKLDQNEDDYTRLRLDDDDDTDEVHLRTRYLFDEDKAMTPLSQMQATKDLLTEAQRIAYVGVCALAAREMIISLRKVMSKDLKPAINSLELWSLKIMGRLYYHMELETAEQKMIESLAEHGVSAMDLVPALMTTHTIANPEYDPAEARRKEAEDALARESEPLDEDYDITSVGNKESVVAEAHPATPRQNAKNIHLQTTANVMEPMTPTVSAIPGVSTSLSTTDANVTLDIRWTVLCDLFLILIADSVYDARSRVLLEVVATKLGLGWIDVVKFEKRVTEALEIQEGIERLEHTDVIEGRSKSVAKKRYMMVGLATLGGGLVIGLSAGLLAPVIGLGLGAALSTVGITGTAGFLTGIGGAAMITTGGVLTGSNIAGRGMARRTRQVKTFSLLPIHNNKRVSCIIAVPGFMAHAKDDPRLPFSVLDPVIGDAFGVLWEPEMMAEMGNALKILTSEVLTQVGQTVLQATVMAALMSALQWPLILTKLGYLIDNPWSNALDRARAAGLVLADVLIERSLGVRPISLIGYSLGARAIFFALIELSRKKAFGIVQDVFLLGTTLTASTQQWLQVRGAVAGRLVNCFARNDWLLNYLFRATTAGIGTVAGLRPVDNVPGLENVDVTDKILGHLSYRTFMPIIMDQLGFPVTATYFDELEEPEMEGDRIVVRETPQPVLPPPKKRFSWFSRNKSTPPENVPPSGLQVPTTRARTVSESIPEKDDGLPERIALPTSPMPGRTHSPTLPPYTSAQSGSNLPSEKTGLPIPPESPPSPDIAPTAGFDFKAIGAVLGKADLDPNTIRMPQPSPAMRAKLTVTPRAEPSEIARSESAPPPFAQTQTLEPPERETTPKPRLHTRSQTEYGADALGAAAETTTTRTRLSEPEEDDGEDVTAMFQRSASLDGPSGLGLTPGSGGFGNGFGGGYTGQGFAGGSNGFGLSPRLTEEPSFSFGTTGGNVWPPTNPFATPSTSSLPSPSPFGGNYVPPTPPNPFSDSTLSLGASDGSITSWPSQPTKKSSLPSNPWET
ncbi:putative integral membrane protein [Rhizoctonia solani 123E]|uniref:Putative integral membrane protein n=1 Tax=Rhizoctonia solani 123E TaxID=1423351 RepID=A0A074S1J2_9AGAM|nr:putative integral membrane protein [Rhizoctonia solani 123E]